MHESETCSGPSRGCGGISGGCVARCGRYPVLLGPPSEMCWIRADFTQVARSKEFQGVEWMCSSERHSIQSKDTKCQIQNADANTISKINAMLMNRR